MLRGPQPSFQPRTRKLITNKLLSNHLQVTFVPCLTLVHIFPENISLSKCKQTFSKTHMKTVNNANKHCYTVKKHLARLIRGSHIMCLKDSHKGAKLSCVSKLPRKLLHRTTQGREALNLHLDECRGRI